MSRSTTFTTYVNMEEAKGVDRALSSLEQKANSTFARIASQAAKASTLSNGTGAAGQSPQSIQALAGAERQRAVALQATVAAQNAARASSARLTSQHMLESNAARATSRETSNLERALRLSAVAANVAQGPLGPLAGRLSAMATAVRELAGVRLGLVGVGAGLGAFIHYASAAQDLKSKLYPLFDSQQQVNAAFKDTIRIANAARLSLDPVVDLYAKLTLGGRDVGLSQQRITALTETAAKAAKLSGGTQQSQDAGLYQFAQGIGSGNLGGDELKSVRENNLRLAKAIADGWKNADGSIGTTIANLKKLGKAGDLTATRVADAVARQSSKIDAELAKLPESVSGATARLQNAFNALINGTDDAYGTTRALAAGLGFLADNLDTVAATAFRLLTVYTAIRAVDMARTTLNNVAAWNAERVAVANNAAKVIESSSTARRASAERIVALRAERAQLQANMIAEQQLAATTRQAAISASKKFSGPDYIGSPQDFQVYRTAVEQANVANQNFAASKNRLRNIAGDLKNEMGGLTTNTSAYRSAAIAAGKASSLFASAGRALWGVIGPNLLGLALGVGISLLIQFATAESDAAGAADRMAASQANLAHFINLTTGAIIENNKALLNKKYLEQSTQAKESRRKYYATRDSAQTSLDRLANQFGNSDKFSPEVRRQLIAARDDYAARRITSAEASDRVRAAAKADRRIASSRNTSDAVYSLGNAVDLGREATSDEAGRQLLAGNNTAENRRRANGNFTGRDVVDTPISTGAADKKLGNARAGRAKSTDEAAKAERELQKVQERTDKRTNILAGYDATPKAMDKAITDARELAEMIGKEFNGVAKVSKANPLGKGIYTKEMAAADKAAIDYGVRQPIRDAIDEQQRGLDISAMRLEGYDLEANALEKALSLQDRIREVTRSELVSLIENERSQLRINDALASRERQVAGILDAANQTRDAFENMLVGLSSDGLGSIKQFGKQILNNIMHASARQLTEKLFAGADEKLRDLISGSNGVDRANDLLKQNVTKASDSTTRLAAANDNLASATETVASRMIAVANNLAGGGVSGLAASGTSNHVAAASQKEAITAGITAALGNSHAATALSLGAAVAGGGSGLLGLALQDHGSATQGIGPDYPASEANPTGYIEAVGARTRGQPLPGNTHLPAGQPQQGPAPSGSTAYGKVFETLGEKLDKTFKSGTFFKGIGKGVGQALGGAGEGMMASGVASALGIKQSSTGAAIGGAIGSFIPGIGGVIGGLIGGTLGGLFSKTKTGSASLGQNAFGYAGVIGTGGNDAQTTKAVSGLAGSVNDQLNQIADSLGGSIGAFNVAIGKRKDEYRVSGTGNESSTTSKKGNSSDIVYKGTDEAGAIAAAVQNALEDGVITGISEASKNILKSGQNLQTALTKATAIESIGKRLMAKTDPMRYAVQTLNDEFTRLISYLKEGKASAEQFADAQKLYDLERADAIKQATQQSVAALQAYMDEMKGGNSSPFNKQTVYENAAAKLAGFRGDIASGKIVDQQELLNASKNFQDASQKLYGSSESFFQDFNDLFALLAKARDNALGTGSTDLPGSPFAAADMSTYLTQINQTTSDQTATLGGKLDSILAAILTEGGTFNGPAANWNVALGMLPGVA